MKKIVLLLGLFLAGPLFGAGENILLITLDTTRLDALSCYGGKRGRTPVLDSIAGQSIRFTRAYAPVPQTLPAHAAILTGTYPFQNGVRDNVVNALGPEPETLASVLKSNGYSTAAILASAVLNRRFGLARGFDHYDDAMPGFPPERKAAEVTDLALQKLKTLKPPFFLWVHYYDPHHPYDPPSAFRSGKPYYDEVTYMDGEIGRLLKAVDWKSSLLIATGDHGEMLGEHNEFEHGLLLYESALRVPLLIHRPRQAREIVLDHYVSIHAIAPTILDALGLPIPKSMDGRSLLDKPDKGPVYIETMYPFVSYRWSPLKGLIWKGHKLVTTARIDELYALSDDPGETRNLAAAQTGLLTDLKARLRAINPEGSNKIRQHPARDISPELQKQIQSLGYIAGSFLETKEISDSLPHPKDLADIPNFVLYEGPQLLKQKNTRDFFTRIKDILKRDPGNYVVMNLAGIGFWSAGNFDRALEIFSQALRIAPKAYYLMGNLGRTEYFLKRYEDSERTLRKALELNPFYAEGYDFLFDTTMALGKSEQAEGVLREARDKGLSFPRMTYNQGIFLMQKGNCREAVPLFKESLKAEPDQPDALGNLAQCSMILGDAKAAWDYIQQGLAVAPNDFKMLKVAFNFALKVGKTNEAREIARTMIRLFPFTEESRQMRERFPDLP